MIIRDGIVVGAGALEQLENRQALVVPYAARTRLLADRLGQDFEATIQVFDNLPLAQNGDRHTVLRAKTAQFLALGRARLRLELPGLVARHFNLLETSNTLDMMKEIVVPFADDCLAVITQVEGCFESDSMISRVFSQSSGVVKRRRLNGELATTRQRIEEQCPFAETNDVRLTLMILGRDALIGTLAGSLALHFKQAAGRQLSEDIFDSMPTRTGVPYVDRIMPDGKVVRCELSGLRGDQRSGFFGKGAHVCLGRAISRDIFSEVSQFLSRVDRHVHVRSYHLRKDDVFDIPEIFEVGLWNKK